jgi:hypothetical protein
VGPDNWITFDDPDNEDDNDNWHREEFKESHGNFCERVRKLVPRRARSPEEGAFPVTVARIVYRVRWLIQFL